MARRLTARPLPAWVGDLPVFERTLANGFKAWSSPVRTPRSWFATSTTRSARSTSRPGKTGLAHFVEHMLFKGTERFPKGQIDRLAFIAAGQSNAETGEDSTHYWFAFPSDRWELALAIEADRMSGATFDAREIEAERHVIVEERARDLDRRSAGSTRRTSPPAYLRHPYRNPILGWPEDLARIARRRPRSRSTATLPAGWRGAGDRGRRRRRTMPRRVRAPFRPMLRGRDRTPRRPIDEPRQTGRRDFTLIETESVARGLFGWHTVPRGHPDGPALDVLSDLLTCGRRSAYGTAGRARDRLATWVETGAGRARTGPGSS